MTPFILEEINKKIKNEEFSNNSGKLKPTDVDEFSKYIFDKLKIDENSSIIKFSMFEGNVGIIIRVFISKTNLTQDEIIPALELAFDFCFNEKFNSIKNFKEVNDSICVKFISIAFFVILYLILIAIALERSRSSDRSTETIEITNSSSSDTIRIITF